jgi:Na+-driven multidrug efflux pump/anti-sigma regulatory factor (Ser/Thr protein kinase)
MNEQAANAKMITKLMLRLLPIQVLLAAVGAVNGIVSGFFATNYVGISAMSAVGLYAPLGMLVTSISTILIGGSAILCGKYMGRNEQDKMQHVFSLNLALSALVAALFIALYLLLGIFDLTGFLTRDAVVRPIFNRYLLGQAIGILPLMLGNSFASFLLLENKGRRTLTASLVYIVVNVLLNYLFVQLLHWEAFGLALASSLGMWVFLGVQAESFLSGRSVFRFGGRPDWKESGEILRIGLPGAASNVYQTARGLIVNRLIETFVGSVGISAFAASDSLMRIFWALPAGMLAVSRLMISVSVGEEDRQSLADIMRVMFRRFLPMMGTICAAIILCAVPMTRIFYRDSSEPVYMMTVWGLRILPLCMPLSIICMHFTCYGQTSGKQGLVHLLALLDGVVCVAGFTALLIRSAGMNSVYIANVLNGVVTTLVIIGYAWLKKKQFPRDMDELMVIPEDFGAPESERMDLSVKTLEDVVRISEQVQAFCLERGVDTRRAYLAGLAMEEMAGNIVDHGFTKDRRTHAIDVRVAHKDEDVILRIKDDCVPFDPHERRQLAENDDVTKNIGIRMVFRIARDVQYQNILGLNVLTIRI